MSIVWWIVLVTAIAGVGGTGLGGLVGLTCKRDSEHLVSLFLSFAGGVMLAVVCFDLIGDALFTADAAKPALLSTAAGILVGYGVIYLLNYWIDKGTNHELPHTTNAAHPKTADAPDELIHADHLKSHMEQKSNLFVAGVIMACAIALHNLPEGMVIGAAYASNGAADLYSGSGFVMAIVIGLHNIPEGMAVAVPLIAGGMSKGKSVLITALSGLPTVLGAVLGYHLGTMGPAALTFSLSFASGAMLYVVFGELLPEAILMWRSKLPAFAILLGLLVGMLIIFA